VNGKQIMPHDKKAEGIIIGDGIVVANTFGSTGYFKSITKKSFTKGIGIALNNTNTDMDSVLTENAEIRFELKRNNAGFSVDNDKKIIVLKPGDSVIIKPSVQRARIIKFEK
jgi:NAD kinase